MLAVNFVMAAVFMAAILYFFVHDVFEVTNKKIVIDSLAIAGLLCLMFSLGEMRARGRK